MIEPKPYQIETMNSLYGKRAVAWDLGEQSPALYMQQIGRAMRPSGHWNSQKRRWRRQCRKTWYKEWPKTKFKHSKGWRKHLRQVKSKGRK